MIIEYEFQTGASEIDDELGEEYFDTEKYAFEPEDVSEALTDIIFDTYFAKISNKDTEDKFKSQLQKFIEETYDDDYFYEMFEDELKDYYKEQAEEEFAEIHDLFV